MSRESRLERFGRLTRLNPKTDVMPEAQRLLWQKLGEIPDDFVLYGGTGLALRLGHRESVDFDFFSAEPFAPGGLLGNLGWLGIQTVDRAAPNTLSITACENVHVSFFGRMAIRTVAEPELAGENGIVVASLYDLAGTKAKAVYDRAEWRDYFDIASLLQTGEMTLMDILGYARTIFEPGFEFPVAVVLKALAWFEDGTVPDLPEDMKRYLRAAVADAYGQELPLIEPYSASIAP
jgi:Nucleotidyl transferase AbiEii toxin, Type IV TA system